MAPLPYECGHSGYGHSGYGHGGCGPVRVRRTAEGFRRRPANKNAGPGKIPQAPGGTTSPPAAGFPGASLRSQQMTSPVRLGRERGDAPCGRRRRLFESLFEQVQHYPARVPPASRISNIRSIQ